MRRGLHRSACGFLTSSRLPFCALKATGETTDRQPNQAGTSDPPLLSAAVPPSPRPVPRPEPRRAAVAARDKAARDTPPAPADAPEAEATHGVSEIADDRENAQSVLPAAAAAAVPAATPAAVLGEAKLAEPDADAVAEAAEAPPAATGVAGAEAPFMCMRLVRRDNCSAGQSTVISMQEEGKNRE